MFPKNNPFYNLLYAALIPIQQALGLGHTHRPTTTPSAVPTSYNPSLAPFTPNPSIQPSISTSLIPTQLPSWLTQIPTYFYTNITNTSSPTTLTSAPTVGEEIADTRSLEGWSMTLGFGLVIMLLTILYSALYYSRRNQIRLASASHNDLIASPLLGSSINSEVENLDSSFLYSTLTDCMLEGKRIHPNAVLLKKHLMQYARKGIRHEDLNLRKNLKEEILRICVEQDDPSQLTPKGKALLQALKDSGSCTRMMALSLNQLLDCIPTYYLILGICILGAGAYFVGSLITFGDMSFDTTLRVGLSLFAMLVGGFINLATVNAPSAFLEPLTGDEQLGSKSLVSLINDCTVGGSGGLNAYGYTLLSTLDTLIRNQQMTRADKFWSSTPALLIPALSSATLSCKAPWQLFKNFKDLLSPTWCFILSVKIFVFNSISTFLGLRGAMEQRANYEQDFWDVFKNYPKLVYLLNALLYLLSLTVIVIYATPAAAEMEKDLLPDTINESVRKLMAYGLVGINNWPTYQQTILAFHAFVKDCADILNPAVNGPIRKGCWQRWVRPMVKLVLSVISLFIVGLVNRGNAKSQAEISFKPVFGESGLYQFSTVMSISAAIIEGVTGLFSSEAIIQAFERIFRYHCCKKPLQAEIQMHPEPRNSQDIPDFVNPHPYRSSRHSIGTDGIITSIN